MLEDGLTQARSETDEHRISLERVTAESSSAADAATAALCAEVDRSEAIKQKYMAELAGTKAEIARLHSVFGADGSAAVAAEAEISDLKSAAAVAAEDYRALAERVATADAELRWLHSALGSAEAEIIESRAAVLDAETRATAAGEARDSAGAEIRRLGGELRAALSAADNQRVEYERSAADFASAAARELAAAQKDHADDGATAAAAIAKLTEKVEGLRRAEELGSARERGLLALVSDLDGQREALVAELNEKGPAQRRCFLAACFGF